MNNSKDTKIIGNIDVASTTGSNLKVSKVRVWVSYSKGIYSGRRGYDITAMPFEPGSDGINSFIITGGSHTFLEEAKRFSEKKLGEVVASVSMDDPRVLATIDACLTRNHLKRV